MGDLHASIVTSQLMEGQEISDFSGKGNDIPVLLRPEIWIECYEMRVRATGRGITWSVIFHRHLEDCVLVFLLAVKTPSRNRQTIQKNVLRNKSIIRSRLRRYYGDGLLGLDHND